MSVRVAHIKKVLYKAIDIRATHAGETGSSYPAPKEQPPRKLSGKWTAG
jgi:hypothetical protein